MTSCCSPESGFPLASVMQQISLNSPVIWQEICAIQQAILSASSQCQPSGGKMFTVVAGNTPMTFVSGVTSVNVTNGGSGYLIDHPGIKFIPPIGRVPTSEATATAVTNGGSILAVTVTSNGSGYLPVESTITVDSLTGNNAILKPIVDSAGAIAAVEIQSGGTGYSVSDTVVSHRILPLQPWFIDADIRISAVSVTGAILSVSIVKAGTGYSPSTTGIAVVSSINSNYPYPTGAGFSALPVVSESGEIISVVVKSIGSGYADYVPYLSIVDQGTGAQTQVTVASGSVTGITVTESGSGYTTSATGTVYNPPTAPLPNPPSNSAVVAIVPNSNTFGTDPNHYWSVWSGITVDKAVQLQINQVQSYFKSLGYTVTIQTNPDTGSTIQWLISW